MMWPEESRSEASRESSPFFMSLIPGWKLNLFVFGLLILIVLLYFYWQVENTRSVLKKNVTTYAEMLGGVIRLNAVGSELSTDIVEEVMGTFLGSEARFIDFLDAIEPFSEDELLSFAREAGLAGISIIRPPGKVVEGPLNWLEGIPKGSIAVTNDLKRHSEKHLYYLTAPGIEKPGRIIVGITSRQIEALHDRAGLPHLVKTLTSLEGVKSVAIEPFPKESGNGSKILLQGGLEDNYAKIRLKVGNKALIVNLHTGHFFMRIKHLKREFVIIGIFLGLLGCFFSWFLYRLQSAYLLRVRDFERDLAREREDAALGRAAAAITHEIKNPLNAISMGLQRIQMESLGLEDEYNKLIDDILGAVRRTDSIVSDIKQYSKPLKINPGKIDMVEIVEHIISLYGEKCRGRRIEIIRKIKWRGHVPGDPVLLSSVVENLVKNGVEAQPEGGYLMFYIDKKDNEIVFSFENSGCKIPEKDVDRIFEPYYTNKTRGTGLGLGIAHRIIKAHKGRIVAERPARGLLKIIVSLPLGNTHEKINP